MQATRTTTTPWMSWFCRGHSTFLSSAQDSPTKFANPLPGTWRSLTSGARGAAARGAVCVDARAREGAAAPSGAPPPSARRARRCARVCLANDLPGLPVRGVLTAPAAVLLELDAVGGVPLRFLGLVVPPLALGAGERDCDSDSGLGCHLVSSSALRRLTHRA